MPAMILKTTWTVNIAQYTATNLRRLVMAPIKLGNKSEAGEVEPITIAATQDVPEEGEDCKEEIDDDLDDQGCPAHL